MKAILVAALLSLVACTGAVPASDADAVDGDQGPPGPQGPVGPQGPAGLQGASGAQGPVGPGGPAGAAGAQGPNGLDGSPGAAGAQGSVGPTGATGATGAQGPKGDPGAGGPALIAYGRDGKRLGLFVNGAFVTYGTDAFPTPDGVYVSMAPTPIYFANASCLGSPFIMSGDADGNIRNQYWWTTIAIYERASVAPVSAQVRSRMVGDGCTSLGSLVTTPAYPLVSIGGYNFVTALPLTVALE